MLDYPSHKQPARCVACIARRNNVVLAVVALVVVKMISYKLSLSFDTPLNFLSTPMAWVDATTYTVVQNLPVLIKNTSLSGDFMQRRVDSNISIRRKALSTALRVIE